MIFLPDSFKFIDEAEKADKEHYLSNFDEETRAWLYQKGFELQSIYDEGIRQVVNYFDAQGFSEEELIAIWTILDSKIRTAYKLHNEKK